MTLYYATHDAAGGGGGLSVGDPLTLQEAFDTAVAGDEVRICNTGTYTPSATIDLDTNDGHWDNPIQYIGANSVGTVDGSIATISGSSLPASTNLISLGTDYNEFSNLRFTAATQYNIADSSGTASTQNTWRNCRIDNATSHAFYQLNGSSMLVDCEIDNNGGDGNFWGTTSTNRNGTWRLYNCSIHDNGGNGWSINNGTGSIFINCLFYDNGGKGFSITRDYSADTFISCTFDGNTGDGFGVTSSEGGQVKPSIYNCIFSNNGGYGINWFSGFDPNPIRTGYNHFYNNTSGHRNNWPSGEGDVEGSNPNFTSRTDSSEDFEPQQGSPVIDAGMPLRTGGS